jgi:hypothetical protein
MSCEQESRREQLEFEVLVLVISDSRPVLDFNNASGNSGEHSQFHRDGICTWRSLTVRAIHQLQ